jgi:hypothetical protein
MGFLITLLSSHLQLVTFCTVRDPATTRLRPDEKSRNSFCILDAVTGRLKHSPFLEQTLAFKVWHWYPIHGHLNTVFFVLCGFLIIIPPRRRLLSYSLFFTLLSVETSSNHLFRQEHPSQTWQWWLKSNDHHCKIICEGISAAGHWRTAFYCNGSLITDHSTWLKALHHCRKAGGGTQEFLGGGGGI